jgi:hypothetical protein
MEPSTGSLHISPRPLAVDRCTMVPSLHLVETPLFQDTELMENLVRIFRPALFVGERGPRRQQYSSSSSAVAAFSRLAASSSAPLHPSLYDDLRPPRQQEALEEGNDDNDDGVSELSHEDRASSSGAGSGSEERFRAYQNEEWQERFDDLVQFKQANGHVNVPVRYKPNPALGFWVKRMRYQHTLKREGKRSTLTDEREQALEQLGMVWHSRSAQWDKKFQALVDFRRQHGDCNVFSRLTQSHPLCLFVKSQRQQYKLYQEGRRSNLNSDRISRLNSIGFVWEASDE